jgi:PAS domain S-box-containing protein
MNYQFTHSFFLQLLPCLIAAVLIQILWNRRHINGVLYMILLEVSASIWAITENFEHASTTVPLKILWSEIGSFGTSTTGVFFLLFTLSFTQRYKFTNIKSILLLLVIPVITIILSFTNQFHHLIFEGGDLLPLTNDIVYHFGKWFWVFVFYEYSIIILAIIILLLSASHFYKIYKNQVYFLIGLYIFPLITSILFVFKLTPLNVDLTPTSLICSGICVGMGIYWKGMIEIMPVARKQIIENLSDGIIVVDMADRIIDANPAIETITGYKHKDIIDQPFGMIKELLFQQLIDKSTPDGFSTELVIKVNNKQKYFEVTSNHITDNDQKLIGNIFILHDITKRKKALDSAVESNNRLRHEIKENEKLIADLDAYARSVAHDLKNPICGLLGLSEVIKDCFINQKQEEAFDLLDLSHKQTLKMYKIVDELLLLSRIRKEEIKPVALDMASIFNEALKRLNGQYEKNKVSIEMPNAWPTVLGHAQWIEEVWFNFISNAVKYGGDPPLIKTGFDKINNSFCRFWIQDNGNGLPAESFVKVFNDFERLDRKNIEGHGLGLSIVKRIIEKLGGEVSVNSENYPERGCIFSFTLKSVPERLT